MTRPRFLLSWTAAGPGRPARGLGRGLLAGLVALWLTGPGCGGDVESRMAEVRALQDVGQFSASIDELRQVLAIDPDLPEATYRLGVALVQVGEPARAVWALEKAAESEEYAIPAALLLSSAHFSQHNYEASLRAADRVLELDPDRDAALRLRAQSNLGAGRLDEALADTQRLMETYPDDYAVNVLNAVVLGDMGGDKLEEARIAHDRVKEIGLASGDPAVAPRGCLFPALFARDNLKDSEKAEALYDDCADRFPTNGFVISETMKFYDGIGKQEKATELIRRAVEQAPENLSLRSHLASRLGAAGDDEGAEQVLLEAVNSFQSPGAWSLLAGFYRAHDRHQQALEALEKVAELSGGGSDQLLFTQADVMIDLEQYDRAEEIAASLKEQTYAKLLRGRIALERGDPQSALLLFEQGLRAWPNNAGARFLAGRAARELGDLERAISEFREAVRVEASATPAAELLARTYYDRGQYTDAIRFAKIATRRPGADLASVYVIAARSFTELGQYADARITIKTLSQLEGQKARATIELASVERAAEGPEAALKAIDEADLDLTDPENEQVLRVAVDNLLAANDARRALSRVDAALREHPGESSFLELRGAVLIHMGRDEDALAALQQAVEKDPENAAAYGGLATLAARRNDLKGAVELFDKAAELSPKTSSYPYSAAQLALAAGDESGAEQRLRDITRRFPSHAGARNDLAWILAEKGAELDWALELAEDAQRLDPSPEVLDTLGWVRLKRGETSAAVAALEQAAEARSDSPSIRYRLGVALAQAGDAERAREMLEAAIEAGSFPEAADAQRELARLTP